MYISEIRKQKGYSQKYVAKAVGVSQNALCQYEKGKRKPSPELLIKLADLFNCTIDELIRGGKQNERDQEKIRRA